MSAEIVSRSLTSPETAKGYFISKKEGYIDNQHFILVEVSNQSIFQLRSSLSKCGQTDKSIPILTTVATRSNISLSMTRKLLC